MTRTRRPRRAIILLAVVAFLSLILESAFDVLGGDERTERERVTLPEPAQEGDVSVERAIAGRRSRRSYGDGEIGRDELSQLLWAAQGITDPSSGHRAAPSAGATYPLEVYVVVGTPGVTGVDTGTYHYRPADHGLVRMGAEDVQSALRDAAVDQEWVGAGAIDVVVCAVDERTTQRYGERGERRYVPMEAGHVGENVALQAESLDLSMVTVGAFRDAPVRDAVGIPDGQRPLYVIPVGRRK